MKGTKTGKYGKNKSYRGKSKKGVQRGYKDSHNFKLQALETKLYNTGSGSVSVGSTGIVTVGSPVSSSTSGTTFNFGGAFQFVLKNTYQISQLQTLFDRYRINGIKVKVIPQSNVSDVTNSGTLPTIRLCYDYDDLSNPTPGDIWSRRGIERRLDKPFNVYIKPKMLNQVYGGPSLPVGNSPVPAGWLDMASTNVPHFGLKYAIKDWTLNSNPNTLAVRFEVTYYCSFKEQMRVGALGQEATLFDEMPQEDQPCEDKEILIPA